MSADQRELVLALSCPDQKGLVSAVAGYLFAHGCNIVSCQQHEDALSGNFFMRVRASYLATTSLEALQAAFQATADTYGMTWIMTDSATRQRVAILVSKAEHCLNDLLFRWRSGQLKIDIPFIASNHPDLAPVAEAAGIPFHHIPVTPATKPEAEARLLELIDEHDIDLTVLARYMQILSDDLSRALEGKMINIHHSFLPGFKGAKPYHQAYDRGVKLIGATAHYVTSDLDEGPIIEQEVLRVNHKLMPEDLVAVGQDAERVALSRAVRWHTEHRVLLNGTRTVVFN
ncbi:MAG: formyltetrahydrofolate deformylase [Herbiconiux sp.]|uniref:formyltetrahydrofolate deformylase n=1 Tax=Herbiconiux sp. TaxID=1871186 RepID=UPI001219BAF8|nr:formyltetrahydrofolate deformylase [Herbiconiux sp.]TAJ46901.1 MAG: formyltetrahydrofolate deformylase [Herbiconiux sp.]